MPETVVIERPDSDRVPSQDEPPPVGVEETQGEVSVQVFGKPIAEGIVGSQDEGRIGRPSGNPWRCLEKPQKRLTVVEPAVKDERRS
jgi:hypothetical protein